jgi:hypothetical protein
MHAQVREGGVPNEHGTWQYGRNGWCDGQNVRPWLADVSADLHAPGAGKENVVEYVGLFEGSEPDPKDTPGYIMMQSGIAFYGDAEESAGSSALS